MAYSPAILLVETVVQALIVAVYVVKEAALTSGRFRPALHTNYATRGSYRRPRTRHFYRALSLSPDGITRMIDAWLAYGL